MKLRGIIRLAAAAAATVLVVGGLGAPAYAGNDDDLTDIDFPGASLVLDEPVWAADAPDKGCAGIDTGTAVPGKDGWLFSKPAGEYTDLQYVIVYIKDDGEDLDDIIPLVLNGAGVFTFAEDPNPEALAKSLKANAITATKVEKLVLPTGPAPAGVTGALTGDGGWIKSPAGWALVFGGAFTDPMLKDATFELLRACAAAVASPSASPAVSTSPTAGGGSQLPVTGTNVWVLSGAGVALVAVGAVLFLAYRRRQSVKFVA